MKFSLTLGQRRPLDRQTAWGCLTANLVGVPGLGSLAAGRRSGYAQMALSLGGLALTGAFGIRVFIWFSSSSNGLQDLQDQPGAYFHELWIHIRWCLLGIAVFLCGWLWALASSLAILAESRSADKSTSHPLPPKL